MTTSLSRESLPFGLTMTTTVGELTLLASTRGLTGLYFEERYDSQWEEGATPFLEQAHDELTEYFCGERREFSVPLDLHGTVFQQSVWGALRTVPYGQVASYGEIAAAIANPKAVRAVGLANGSNPVSIIVPCHRVIGANGKLTGYGGGLERKRYLLNLESRGAGELF